VDGVVGAKRGRAPKTQVLTEVRVRALIDKAMPPLPLAVENEITLLAKRVLAKRKCPVGPKRLDFHLAIRKRLVASAEKSIKNIELYGGVLEHAAFEQARAHRCSARSGVLNPGNFDHGF